jgi:hypothetical protein
MAYERIFPTENDVGTSDTVGRVMTEPNMVNWFRETMPRQVHEESDGTVHASTRSAALTGLAPSDGGGLVVNFAAGTAIVDGYYVNLTGTTAHTCTDEEMNHVYLQLTVDGQSKVDGAQLVSGSVWGDTTRGLLLANVDCTGGDIQSIEDERRSGNGIVCGRYTGDGNVTRYVDLPGTPVYVVVHGITTGDSEIIGFSAPRIPNWGLTATDQTSGKASVPTSARGFYVVDDQTTLTGRDWLFGSKTWNTGVITDTSKKETTVTVSGAEKGDHCLVGHTAYNFDPDDVVMTVHVKTASTAAVVIQNNSGGTIDLTGTVRVSVLDWDSGTKTINTSQAVYTESQTGGKIPFIVYAGFRVGVESGEDLNTSGKNYEYVAWM